MRTVLFVCTGNTCRSPMAEAIARAATSSGSRTGESVFVASAGVSAVDGSPISSEAIEALRALGIEHQGTAKRLTAEMVRRADLVLGMTAAHVDVAMRLVDEPDERRKIQPLDPEGDIDDPYGLGASAYRSVAERLRIVIPQRLAEVFAT